MDRQYFTVGEIAERLGVSALTIRRWIKAGELPALKLSNQAGYRITDADLSQFLVQRGTTSPRSTHFPAASTDPSS